MRQSVSFPIVQLSLLRGQVHHHPVINPPAGRSSLTNAGIITGGSGNLFHAHSQRSYSVSLPMNKANGMAEERKIWLEAHGAVEGVSGSMKIRAERVNYEDWASTQQLSENSKIVHFQRHGQGYHNLIYRICEENGVPITDIYNRDPSLNPFVKPEIRDSPLTELGRAQCDEQRTNVVQKHELNPGLVIVSPLSRALMSAQRTFRDAMDAGIPFVAHSGCREELGILTCNWRRPLGDIQREFPHVDFAALEDEGEEDALWSPTEKEAAPHQSQRIYDFLVDFVRPQTQREVAVVGHSAWLFTMCNAVIDCGEDEELASWFGTSEIRSMKLTWEPQEEEEGKANSNESSSE